MVKNSNTIIFKTNNEISKAILFNGQHIGWVRHVTYANLTQYFWVAYLFKISKWHPIASGRNLNDLKQILLTKVDNWGIL